MYIKVVEIEAPGSQNDKLLVFVLPLKRKI